jgi:hypothetical protein
MMPDNLTAAARYLEAAHDALVDELITAPDTFALCDAESLSADALAQVRAEIVAREDARPRRYDWLGGAA